MNIIEVDMVAMTVSLKEQFGGMILFESKSAFPSVSHEYMTTCLEHIGLPQSAINAIKALYSQVRRAIRFKGSAHEPFGVHRGIRQGCPLSPILFAAVVDVLLRRLQRMFPDVLIRAFAHDIGTVFRNLLKVKKVE